MRLTTRTEWGSDFLIKTILIKRISWLVTYLERMTVPPSHEWNKTKTHTITNTVSSRCLPVRRLLSLPHSLTRFIQPLINVCMRVCIPMCVFGLNEEMRHTEVSGLKREVLLHYLVSQLGISTCLCVELISTLQVIPFVSAVNRSVTF